MEIGIHTVRQIKEQTNVVGLLYLHKYVTGDGQSAEQTPSLSVMHTGYQIYWQSLQRLACQGL